MDWETLLGRREVYLQHKWVNAYRCIGLKLENPAMVLETGKFKFSKGWDFEGSKISKYLLTDIYIMWGVALIGKKDRQKTISGIRQGFEPTTSQSSAAYSDSEPLALVYYI